MPVTVHLTEAAMEPGDTPPSATVWQHTDTTRQDGTTVPASAAIWTESVAA